MFFYPFPNLFTPSPIIEPASIASCLYPLFALLTILVEIKSAVMSIDCILGLYFCNPHKSICPLAHSLRNYKYSPKQIGTMIGSPRKPSTAGSYHRAPYSERLISVHAELCHYRDTLFFPKLRSGLRYAQPVAHCHAPPSPFRGLWRTKHGTGGSHMPNG